MAITSGGPYNIPPGGPEGASGHIQWSTDVADSVNDLDARVSLRIQRSTAIPLTT